jgi:hypothetical protein
MNNTVEKTVVGGRRERRTMNRTKAAEITPYLTLLAAKPISQTRLFLEHKRNTLSFTTLALCHSQPTTAP